MVVQTEWGVILILRTYITYESGLKFTQYFRGNVSLLLWATNKPYTEIESTNIPCFKASINRSFEILTMSAKACGKHLVCSSEQSIVNSTAAPYKFIWSHNISLGCMYERVLGTEE